MVKEENLSACMCYGAGRPGWVSMASLLPGLSLPSCPWLDTQFFVFVSFISSITSIHLHTGFWPSVHPEFWAETLSPACHLLLWGHPDRRGALKPRISHRRKEGIDGWGKPSSKS
jgi:hypothetical protein